MTFKMRRLKKMHLLVVKIDYEKGQKYAEVLVDDVSVQRFKG